ncbi:MAG: TylF/MycF/NovP-related O-methyltransferase [Patescibacteria group bacterium]
MYIKNLLRRLKQLIRPVDKDPVIDIDKEFLKLYKKYKTYTMTTKIRLYALYKAVNYIIDNNIPGDFVECGVWRGGNMMLIADILENKNITNRKIYLYDTFEGMSEPKKVDVIAGSNFKNTFEIWSNSKKANYNEWCYASIEEVKNNMKLTNFPQEKIIYVKGKVEITLSKNIPDKIALLRLDTDWYESTKKELDVLYPNLSKNGVLIIDDYGTWEGARKAVDEYFTSNEILLSRIDHTARIGIKISQ